MAKVAVAAISLAGVAAGEGATRLTADVASAESLVQQQEQCIVSSTNFEPSMANVSHTRQTSYEACQVSCALTPGCAYFSFNKYVMECNYAEASAKPKADYRFVSGKAICKPGDHAPAVMCKTELPKNGFPGLTAEQSGEAWPFGRQPKSLECWPRTSEGRPAQCKLTTVIEDSKDGWPGVCWGLQKKDVPTTECDEACATDPECPSYQIEDDNCYMGLGRECYVRESARDWMPTRAQRYQHGTVRVLMDLKGWQVTGLSKVFRPKADYFDTHEEAAERCKMACYSDIDCQYWIYSTEYGCWVEDIRKFTVKYPVTTKEMTRDSTFAQTAIAGEMVQHICEEATDESLTAPHEAPFCAITGYRLDPLDLTEAHVENSADLCQKRCFNTPGCTYFSYAPKNGKCHLESSEALLVKDPHYISGPQVCPRTTPGPQASCELHPQCSAMGFEGICCPTPEGSILDCCSQSGLDTVPSRAEVIHAFEPAGDEEPWIYYWWPLLLASAVVASAFAFFLVWTRRGRTKRALLPQQEPNFAPAFDMGFDDAREPSFSQQALPFPEAGLPDNHLPFPQAGLPYHGMPASSYAFA